MANEVGGDDQLISVLEDALVLALRSSLEDSLDFVVLGGLLEAGDEIDDGDVESGDTESETAKSA